jgi:hypothetical protein
MSEMISVKHVKLVLAIALLAAIMCLARVSFGQTVYTKRVDSQCGSGHPFVFSATNPVVLPTWCPSYAASNICFSINLTDANSSITSLDMYCESSSVSGGVSGLRIPVFVSTDGSGVTTSMPFTLRQKASGGGPPGTSSWTWCVTSPDNYLRCSFFANGVITANVDTINVLSWGLTP